jgi:hypothetical protein
MLDVHPPHEAVHSWCRALLNRESGPVYCTKPGDNSDARCGHRSEVDPLDMFSFAGGSSCVLDLQIPPVELHFHIECTREHAEERPSAF